MDQLEMPTLLTTLSEIEQLNLNNIQLQNVTKLKFGRSFSRSGGMYQFSCFPKLLKFGKILFLWFSEHCSSMNLMLLDH